MPAFNNARLVPSDRYAALLTAIAAAVRAVAPGMPIVVGALLSDTSGAPEKRPAAYMTAVGHCAAATGTRQQPWDNVSLHPYVDPAALAGEITAVQASLTALGGPPRLWITEIDYNLCHAANSPQQQADKLTAAVTVARATGIAECVLWFTFHDWGDGWSCSDPGQMMGLCTVGPDQRIRQRRPAWEAFQRLVTTQ